MNVVNFIIANWDFILLVLAAVAAVVFAVFKGNKFNPSAVTLKLRL